MATLLDLELEDGRGQRAVPSKLGVTPTIIPRTQLTVAATEENFHKSLRSVLCSLQGSNWGMAAFHADEAHRIWYNMSPALREYLSTEFPDAPDAKGDWGSRVFTAYIIWWCLWRNGYAEAMPGRDAHCPKDSSMIARWVNGEGL